MNWWNRNQKIIFWIFAGLLLLVGAILISAIIVGPPISCTNIGCSGGIEIELNNLPADTPYQVIVSFPSGETETLSCNPDPEDNPNSFEKSCFANGAFFSLKQDELPPDEVTVKVLVGEVQVSKLFHPAYKKAQPNGEDCAPVCYSATVTIDIPQ